MEDQGTQIALEGSLAHVSAAARGHFIGGSFHGLGRSGDDVLNPANGAVLLSLPSGDENTVDQAVTAATAALPAWSALTPKLRSDVLLALADRIDRDSEDLSRLEALNTGKPLVVARAEIPQAADALRFFAGAARTASAPASGVYVEAHFSTVLREPVGVVGAIAPWNYPLMMAIWKVAPALAAGNSVVLKPSELTPLTALRLAEYAQEILPPGVLNVVLGSGIIVGMALARHPGVAMISLTGSVASGKSVASAAAESLKRVHLELGGKAPVIVFPDADLDAVAETVREAGFWNSGQECGSATRVLVHEDVASEFTALLLQRVSTLTTGNPCEGEHIELGPLISERQRTNVHEAVEQATRDGGKVIAGGIVPPGAGYFYPPTVITNVVHGSPASREEVFGPVVTIETFTTEQEAFDEANAVRYGLSASVWTNEVSRAHRATAALNFGTVWVNAHLVITSEMPWGGFKESGYGRDMSTYGLDDYTRTKHIMTRIT